MTATEIRRLAPSLPSAEEHAHMGHPDVRVSGKIFATLGYPNARFGTVMVSPQDQDLLVRDHPKAFVPAPGAWGRAGSTSVRLRVAPRKAVSVALEAAWRRRAPKKVVDAHGGSGETRRRQDT